ncbi:MAG: hypothetical protein WC043_09350 [Pseudobdellovibrionaceae bacterium]
MTDDSALPPLSDLPSAQATPQAEDRHLRGVARYGVALDQKLLDRALKSMKGLVRGNGVNPDSVKLGETDLKMLRFGARGVLKLVTEYGTRVETGRNTLAELMPTPEEFRRNLDLVVTDIRTAPEKRQKILDLVTQRPDKGFGVKETRLKVHDLARDFVQHEKCVSCRNTGRIGCTRCGGDGMMRCATCQGRRQIACPRCRGVGQVHLSKGMGVCTQCRGDGKVSCPKCAGRGQTKCKFCAATGQMQCQKCAGTAWLSHLSHIEVIAQISFQIDPEKIPVYLAKRLEKDHLTLIQKHDIEVHVLPDIVPKAKPETPETGITDRRVAIAGEEGMPVNEEPDDSIFIDYDCYCPYGTIQFDLGERIVPALLFGFQVRLLETPSFLMDLTKLGCEALKEAANGDYSLTELHEKLERAARYALLRDLMTQYITLKTPRKITQAMLTRFKAGITAENVQQLTGYVHTIFEKSSRRARLIGIGAGLGLSAVTIAGYFFALRPVLVAAGIPEHIVTSGDVLVALAGGLCGIWGVKIAGLLRRNKIFAGFVPEKTLAWVFPKTGPLKWWSWAISAVIYGAVLVALALTQSDKALIPQWLSGLLG